MRGALGPGAAVFPHFDRVSTEDVYYLLVDDIAREIFAHAYEELADEDSLRNVLPSVSIKDNSLGSESEQYWEGLEVAADGLRSAFNEDADAVIAHYSTVLELIRKGNPGAWVAAYARGLHEPRGS